MEQQHEYAVLGGFNRAALGRFISLAAASISGILTFCVLQLVDLAKALGFPQNAPPIVLSLISAGAVYGGLYWLFDRYLWRVGLVANFLRVPDLAGDWTCQGQTLAQDGTVRSEWSGKVTIAQSWDRIRVRLTTPQSGSSSVAAALQCDDAGGYRLLYHYRNDPRAGNADLQSHRGFADLFVSADRRRAEGDYFNGAGRITFGRMIWARG
ncbi:MAG TPA: hypothetical protein VG227_01400 [Caulobacteraceae bacterium]|nr:hypothetical protein [Caulobacteraceae bacterium]